MAQAIIPQTVDPVELCKRIGDKILALASAELDKKDQSSPRVIAAYYEALDVIHPTFMEMIEKYKREHGIGHSGTS